MSSRINTLTLLLVYFCAKRCETRAITTVLTVTTAPAFSPHLSAPSSPVTESLRKVRAAYLFATTTSMVSKIGEKGLAAEEGSVELSQSPRFHVDKSATIWN